MENRDIYWIKEMIENGEIKFNEGVGASDNPIIFRYEEDYIVQADEFLYMDKHLDIRKIDTLKAFSEIENACSELMQDNDNKVVDIDKYISLEARMCIDCFFVYHGINFLEYDDYYIDAEHNFIRLNMKKLGNVISEGMQLIENLAVKIKNQLSGDIEFEEMEEGELEWVGCYELDDIIFKAFNEEAICDYFSDYLLDEIKDIENENGVLCQIYIEDDELIISFE